VGANALLEVVVDGPDFELGALPEFRTT